MVVCFSSEEFLQPGATDAVSAASRRLRACLEEAAKSFGVRLPVYVLFTKTDRMPFFADYVRNLSNEEAGQVAGVTVEAAAGQTEGVYAERETQRLTEAFNSLFYSLCDRRPDFLAREHDPATLPGVYEFPRELRKLRPAWSSSWWICAGPASFRSGRSCEASTFPACAPS